MVGFKWALLVFALIGLVFVLLSVFGAARWSRATEALHARMDAARSPPAVTRYDPRELEGLPAPAQRYFRHVLTEGQPMIAAVTVQHEGSFNTGEQQDQWRPFTSRQRVVTRRPGFVWDGKVQMLPGLPVRVHDAYVAGEGILHPAILGLFTLVDLRGTGEVAEGELMRWFAEAVWYPTALLPSQGVRWQAVDDRSAVASFSDGAVHLRITFRFGADGMVEAAHVAARGRTVQGRVVPTPWEGVFTNVQLQEGMRVPMTGEVAWLTPEGRRPYWRGTITSLRYEFAP